MVTGLRHYSNVRILVLVFVWFLIGAGAFSDSLDLSDDVGIPIPQSLQAISAGDADEVKQGFSLVRSPSHFPPTLSEFLPDNLQSFAGFLRLPHTRPSASLRPLYESLCTYRL